MCIITLSSHAGLSVCQGSSPADWQGLFSLNSSAVCPGVKVLHQLVIMVEGVHVYSDTHKADLQVCQ